MMRLKRVKNLLWFVLGMGMVVIAARLLTGLGANTSLSHNVSWGLWNAVKISIVPLSAGGFVLAAIVYIFGLEKYRPVLRLSILTGFLGYSTFATMLIFDIGLPYRIWHPMVYWQHHSVLFEVALCVMSYLTVLALEFMPNVLEHAVFKKYSVIQKCHAFLKKVTIPLVIAGIVLSTMHQSSLGSLFLIVPHRLDPLWYSPLIYVHFFISAIGMGLLIISVQAVLLEYFYNIKTPMDILAPLARAGAVMMALFFSVRIIDQLMRGILPDALITSPMAFVFAVEMILAGLLPLMLLSKRIRQRRAWLFTCTFFSVIGVILYRSNVALLAIDWGGSAYFPAWTEIALSLGILAGSALVFFFLIENLNIYYGPAGTRLNDSKCRPDTQGVGLAFDSWLAGAGITAARRYSIFILAGAILAAAFLPEAAVMGARPSRAPVIQTRTVEGFAVPRKSGQGRMLHLANRGTATQDAARVPLLMINGNQNNDLVLFDHKGHIEQTGGQDACATCHHLNMPFDKNTSCYECHRDMYEPTSIFSHASHVHKLGGNTGCIQCHTDTGVAKTYESATACATCHADSAVSGSMLKTPDARWKNAAGYMDVMHTLCISCHEKKVKESLDQHPAALGQCDTCHDADRSLEFKQMAPNNSALK